MTSPASLRLRRLVVSAALGSTALFLAPAANASPESDAKDLFARGRELRSANDCGSAAPLFRKAWTIFPQGLGSLRNLAECEEQLGHFASSRRAWLDLKRALVTAPNDAKYEGWDKDSEEAAARLKPKVATFVVDVYVRAPEGESLANDQSGVEIFVNGESVGTSLVGTPLERDPGTYRIRAQTVDAQPVEQTVTLSAGDNPHVSVRLTRTPRPAVQINSSATSLRTAGWIALGVGGASLIGSGVTYLIRGSALSEVEDKCGGESRAETGPCPTSLQGTIDTGKLMSVLSPILLGVGVVGVGGGLALILTSPRSSTQGKGLVVAPGFGRVDATWRF